MSKYMQVAGATAPSGTKYINVNAGSADAWLPIASFVLGNNALNVALANQGIMIFDPKSRSHLVDQVKGVGNFPPADIVERLGWNGDIFALPEGTIYSDRDDRQQHVAFEIDASKCAQAGYLGRWKRCVAAPLGDQPLGAFVLMLAFVAPLLRFMPMVNNLAFEIVGPRGVGKSTLQVLMSSVIGGIGLGGSPAYWIPLDTTLNAIEDTMAQHSDHPIIFDEANLLYAGSGAKVAAEVYRALAFKLHSGHAKSRLGEERQGRFRNVTIISANESLRDLADPKSVKTDAAADRLLTIRVPTEWAYGVYPHLPDGYGSGAEFAEALTMAARANHGLAYRKFIRKLVIDANWDQDALSVRLKAWQDDFLTRTKVDRNDGSAWRVALAFASVYAAGKLAQRYLALPKKLKCSRAALTCYRLHLAERPSSIPFQSRLEALIAGEKVLTIDRAADTAVQAEMANKALATLWTTPSGHELRIRAANVSKLLPDWERLKVSPEVRERLRTEHQSNHRHDKPKASLAPGMAKERLWCIRLPSEPSNQTVSMFSGEGPAQ